MVNALSLLITVLTATILLVSALFIVYLLTLLVAAAAARKRATSEARANAGAPTESFVIVVPAHDEELVIAATLDSLARLDYPKDRYEVVVVADNCTDPTAQIAAGLGATVLERNNKEERGKGYALDWAFQILMSRDSVADAFVVVDADTVVDPAFLRKSRTHLFHSARPAQVLQGRYGVANGTESWRSALVSAAFELFNHVKPLGRDHLGASVGLKGNGMVFARSVMEVAHFTGNSITEDIDFGLDLLEKHGIAVRYAPAAQVWALMPTEAKQSVSQRRRWEAGRYLLVRQRVPSLLKSGLRSRDARCFEAAIDLMTPPMAELAGMLVVAGILVALGQRFHLLLPGSAAAIWWALLALPFLGYVAFVLGGLALAGARREAYAALLRAPLYALWKFALYASSAPTEWVRTSRTPTPGAPTGAGN